MTHPTHGSLRRSLDEPEALADDIRVHLDQCSRCQKALTSVAADRDRTARVLADRDLLVVDERAGWERLLKTVNADTPVVNRLEATRPRTSQRRRRAPLLAAAGALLVLGGATAAAANDWLPVFRTEAVAPVSVPLSVSDLSSLASLADLSPLSSYGRWQVLTRPALRPVAGPAEVTAKTGLTLTSLTDLPPGVSGEPAYRVMTPQVATFRFSEEKATAAAAAAGQPAPVFPAGVDGAVLRVSAGPGVVRVWQSSAGLPTLVVAQVGVPEASSNGVSLSVLRATLLSLPGLPPRLAEQVRAITSDGSTLPIPVPQGQFSSSPTEVGTAPATLLESTDGTVNAVVWVSGGFVRLVAGPLSSEEVLSVARDLR